MECYLAIERNKLLIHTTWMTQGKYGSVEITSPNKSHTAWSHSMFLKWQNLEKEPRLAVASG